MTHFVRERSDRDWYRGLRVPEVVLRNIDEKTKMAVSATGGTYAPSSPIVIGGAGIELQCAMQLTNAKAQPGVGRVFRFGSSDYFKHEIAVSRSIVDSPLLLLGSHNLPRQAQLQMSVSATTAPALQTRRASAFLRIPLRIPDGARVSGIEIGFKVGVTRANVPALPKARLVRASIGDAEWRQHPYCSSPLFDQEGWVSLPTPASGAAYYNGGALQTLSLTYNALLVDPIDTSLYSYALEWIDDSGITGGAGNYLVYIKTTFQQDDLRPY